MTGHVFRNSLVELRQAIAAPELDADTADIIAGDLATIERQLSKENPSAAIIRTRLDSIRELLMERGIATEAVNRLFALLVEHKPGSRTTPATAGGTQVHDVHTGGGNFVGRDQFTIGDITIIHGAYTGEIPQSRERAEAIYRAVVAEGCGHLPLRGVIASPGEAAAQQPLSLAQVYIALVTRRSASSRLIEAALRGAGRLRAAETPPDHGGFPTGFGWLPT